MPDFQMEHILFATDFLANSRLALDYAVAVAHRFKAKLVIMHTAELPSAAREAEAVTHLPSVSREDAQAYLNEFASGVARTGVQVETRIEDGEPGEAILRAAAHQKTDLLVLGVHGVRRGLKHLIVGSTTEKILLAAPCPTLTVGAHVLAGVGLDLRINRILYLSDFSTAAASAVPFAQFLASTYSAPLETYHVLPHHALGSTERQQQIAADYCNRLRQLLPEAPPTWIDPQCQLDRGMNMDEILDRARSEPSALIVTGVERASFLQRHVESSFAYQLIATAACPVVTVNPEGR